MLKMKLQTWIQFIMNSFWPWNEFGEFVRRVYFFTVNVEWVSKFSKDEVNSKLNAEFATCFWAMIINKQLLRFKFLSQRRASLIECEIL